MPSGQLVSLHTCRCCQAGEESNPSKSTAARAEPNSTAIYRVAVRCEAKWVNIAVDTCEFSVPPNGGGGGRWGVDWQQTSLSVWCVSMLGVLISTLPHPLLIRWLAYLPFARAWASSRLPHVLRSSWFISPWSSLSRWMPLYTFVRTFRCVPLNVCRSIHSSQGTSVMNISM